MSTPIVHSSGSLSTVGSVVSGGGMLTYAEHVTAAANVMYVYDGSTSGALLLTVSSSASPVTLGIPVQFSNGLYVSLSTGTGLLHYT